MADAHGGASDSDNDLSWLTISEAKEDKIFKNR